MSQRKLQQEIDRVLKKVREGLVEFDEVYEKLKHCDNQSQKEKLESDLKKEIKKLQRSREQIKAWITGTEVKDKKALKEHRKLIEREMERFKEVEKMMKTKAFSNEALASATEVVDPRKKEKLEAAEFIEGNIDELQRQTEAIEAEIDQISSTLKKKKSDAAKQAEIDELEAKLGRHKWHISMLESILRHLENDNIEVEQINEIREDIEYYVESNQDDHFVEDDTFYDALGLDEMENSFAVIHDDDVVITTRSQSMSEEADPKDKEKERKEKEKEKEKEKQKEKEKEKEIENEKDLDKEKEVDNIKAKENEKERAKLNDSDRDRSTVSNPMLNNNLKPATPIGTPKIRYATAASVGLKKVAGISSTVSTPTTSTPPPSLVSYASLASSINNTNVEKQSSSANSTPTIEKSNQRSPSPTTQPSVSSSTSASLTAVQIQPLTADEEKLYQDIENLASANAERILTNNEAKNPQVLNIKKELDFIDTENYQNFPPNANKYFENLNKAKERMFDFKKQEELHVPSKKSQPAPIVCELKLPQLQDISAYLESSLLNCPDSFDADKPHRYIPTNPCIPKLNFPVQPLPEILGSKKLLERANLDTLFYGFYYYNLRLPSKFNEFHSLEPNNDDDYLQFIVAQELHRRGWNYQPSTHTWFEGDDTVNGGWRSFDYKNSWTVQRNPEFNHSAENVEVGYF